MKKIACFILIIVAFTACRYDKQKKEAIHYEPTWESLKQHEASPQWFSDAKFGIYLHWGVYTVPAYGFEWYPRLMHIENDKYFGSDIYQYHLKTYGSPSEFGYHDFVPMFKAEHFDPDKWADLFVKAGAKFAGLVAEHSDGFAMWASKATPWNAMEKEPFCDVVGELEKAIKGRSLKFITTFHHACNLQRYNIVDGKKQYHDCYYEHIEGMPTASDDLELKYLYGNMDEKKWLDEVWLPTLKEVIDGYSPDILWFDSGLDLIPEKYREQMAAYYFNKTENKDVVIVRKQNDLPLDMSVNDLEKSRMNKMSDQTWMTDETISTGSWGYTTTLKLKPAKKLVHVLVDIVSKNGVLLLNISPRADGIIPDKQQQILLKIGDWLSKYGEAIYSTRTWYTYGEGPTAQPKGSFENHSDFKHIEYCPDDIRYTTRDNLIYAITLGIPNANQEMLFAAFAKDKLPQGNTIKSVSLLGFNGNLKYTIKDEGLSVTIPEGLTEKISLVFKIETK